VLQSFALADKSISASIPCRATEQTIWKNSQKPAFSPKFKVAGQAKACLLKTEVLESH
jgi:hypothetical protein